MPDAAPLSTTPSLDPAETLAPLLQSAGAVIESVIRGQSMGRTLPPETAIRIRCAPGADYPIGAVVAFRGGRGLVGHRVVARVVSGEAIRFLLTRGDATLVCDPPVEASRVLGEVIAWRDGTEWRPILAAPVRSTVASLSAATTLLLIRSLHRVDPHYAARTAAVLLALGQRLGPGRAV